MWENICRESDWSHNWWHGGKDQNRWAMWLSSKRRTGRQRPDSWCIGGKCMHREACMYMPWITSCPASALACPAPVPKGQRPYPMLLTPERLPGSSVDTQPCAQSCRSSWICISCFQQASVSFPHVKNGDNNIKCDKHLTISEAVISITAGRKW
jgi:hypothetical protein